MIVILATVAWKIECVRLRQFGVDPVRLRTSFEFELQDTASSNIQGSLS